MKGRGGFTAETDGASPVVEVPGQKNSIFFRRRWPWPGGPGQLGESLKQVLEAIGAVDPVLVCLGSPDNPGDELGPLVGSILCGRRTGLPVYGTMEWPIHSENLEHSLALIMQSHPRSELLVVDAATGAQGTIGTVTVRSGMTWPGLGLGKTILPLGDISVTAVVRARAGTRWGWMVRLLRGRPGYWARTLAGVVAEGIVSGLVPSSENN
ncbi:MAG: DUF1256 domain-containing protein [Firmicutes bacterium]|nr:DUF1256 domain-containing protein [Bacillota bacterium]